jgi:hypothetical protein
VAEHVHVAHVIVKSSATRRFVSPPPQATSPALTVHAFIVAGGTQAVATHVDACILQIRPAVTATFALFEIDAPTLHVAPVAVVAPISALVPKVPLKLRQLPLFTSSVAPLDPQVPPPLS